MEVPVVPVTWHYWKDKMAEYVALPQFLGHVKLVCSIKTKMKTQTNTNKQTLVFNYSR